MYFLLCQNTFPPIGHKTTLFKLQGVFPGSSVNMCLMTSGSQCLPLFTLTLYCHRSNPFLLPQTPLMFQVTRRGGGHKAGAVSFCVPKRFPLIWPPNPQPRFQRSPQENPPLFSELMFYYSFPAVSFRPPPPTPSRTRLFALPQSCPICF